LRSKVRKWNKKGELKRNKSTKGEENFYEQKEKKRSEKNIRNRERIEYRKRI
jgi:hypothetical protein